MMLATKPSAVFIVNGIETPLRARCLCGVTLASHMQRAPHPAPRYKCPAFRPLHAGERRAP